MIDDHCLLSSQLCELALSAELSLCWFKLSFSCDPCWDILGPAGPGWLNWVVHSLASGWQVSNNIKDRRPLETQAQN